MVEAEKIRGLLFVVVLVAACKESKAPTSDGASGSTSATASAAAPCGSLGGRCAPEGSTCSPAPIGTGWSHMLSCQGGKWTELEIAPLPQGKTQPVASARTLPKLDLACNADADCVVVSDEPQDDPPRTYACCPGCTQRAVSTSWYKSFQSACAASPAPQCPPIGCAMPVSKAACKSHRCELVTTK